MRPLVIGLLFLLTLSIHTLSVEAFDPLQEFRESLTDIANSIISLLNAIKGVAINIGRVMAGAIIALGLVLWASDIFTYKGKRMILSGIILLILIELIP